MAVSVFVSCGKEEKVSKEPVKSSDVVLLNSFENYEEVYDFYYSGKYRLDCVTDKQYVTDGKYALKYTVGSQEADSSTAYTLGVPLYHNGEEESYRDFSKMVKVTYDVYNASEEEVLLGTSILQKKTGLMYSNMQKSTVKAGEKTTVTYEVNRYEIFYSLGLEGPTHVNIMVKGNHPEVYFDNMRLHYGVEEFVAPDTTIDENELIGFEKAYQSFVTYTTGMVMKSEVVVNPEIASEGMRCVRVYREGIEDGEVLYAGGKFGISATYLGNINFEAYTGEAYVAFDCRTTWNDGNKLWIVPRLIATAGSYVNVANIIIPCDGEWHTVYIPLSFAPQFFDNIEIDFQGRTIGDVYLDHFRMETTVPENVILAEKYSK